MFIEIKTIDGEIISINTNDIVLFKPLVVKNQVNGTIIKVRLSPTESYNTEEYYDDFKKRLWYIERR